jgi:hypothetical protein
MLGRYRVQIWSADWPHWPRSLVAILSSYNLSAGIVSQSAAASFYIFFWIRCSLFILPFDAMESALLKVSLNKQKIRTYNMPHCILYMPNNSQNSLRNISVSQRIITASCNLSVILADIVRGNKCWSLISILPIPHIVSYLLLRLQRCPNAIVSFTLL